MTEIIVPPENEETPQVPELNIDKPTTNSKVITIEFEAKKTNKVSTKDTNQQLYTTDTDAWFEFKETSLEGANGTYSVVFRNRHDGSIFQRTGDVVNGVAYYKIPHQEIRHAGAWRGQIVYTLSNGDTTSREFDYDVKGHILDGKDVREIVVEDFETLMSQLRSMKDNAELELADLAQELENLIDTANQNEINETNRQANEQARESAESVRVSNEEERELNEAERISKDSERDSKIEEIEEDVVVRATNAVLNGDFSQGKDNWRTLGYQSSFEIIDGVAVNSMVDDTKSFITGDYIQFSSGNKIYVSFILKVSDFTNVSEIKAVGGVGNNPPVAMLTLPTNNDFNHYSAVLDWEIGKQIRINPVQRAGTPNVVVSLKSLLAIDLTTTFGKGNEPTVKQMDKLLERFPNSWFDGTVNIYNSKHMMNMFLKELTKLNNAITTLGGNI